jgi:hypothetical protein
MRAKVMFYISFAVALISEGFAIQLFFGDLNGDKVALQSYAFSSLAQRFGRPRESSGE